MKLKEKQPNLKPCPFCGGEPVLVCRPKNYSVHCDDCIAKIPAHLAKAGAVESWNSRVKK